MYSSCECCPQCQSAITSHGIRKVVFANTREQAAEIQFSDAEQYQHIQEFDRWMSNVNNLDNKDALIAALGEHGAVILDKDGKVLAYGDANLDSTDALESLASMNAIRNACKETKAFHLPEGCTIFTRDKIHPISFTTADWARIGRVRDAENPNDTSKDKFEKDSTKTVYLNDNYENVVLRKINGETFVHSLAAEVLNDVNAQPSERKLVITEAINDSRTLNFALKAFQQWGKLIGNDERLKY